MQRLLLMLTSLLFALSFNSSAQWVEKVSSKVSLSVNANIETFFIAEKLAVEHTGNYVFSNKDIRFKRQLIVYFALKEFMPWKDRAVILRIGRLVIPL